MRKRWFLLLYECVSELFVQIEAHVMQLGYGFHVKRNGNFIKEVLISDGEPEVSLNMTAKGEYSGFTMRAFAPRARFLV